jgi:hypothetical protein
MNTNPKVRAALEARRAWYEAECALNKADLAWDEALANLTPEERAEYERMKGEQP